MATKQDILNLNIHKLTQDQYDEAFAAGKIDPNAIYLTPEEVIDLSGYLTKINAANLYLTKEEMETIKNQVTSALNSKQATITGAATTITSNNLTPNRTLVSDNNGKVAVSDITSTELGYLDGVTSNIQTQLNNKQETITGSASTIVTNNLTANRVLISSGMGGGKVTVSEITSSELNCLDNVTSNIQTQLNGIQTQLDGKEPTITTLPITKGGTGATTAAAARTNLETAYCQIKTAKTSATKGWYRIAQTDSGVKNNIGTFEIQSTTTSTNNAYNSTTLLVAGITYIRGAHIEQLSHHANIGDINKARIVYKSTASSSNRAYLEIYGTRDVVRTITVKLVEGFGWSLIDPNTPGEIPSGYQSSGDNGEGLTLIAGALQAEGLVGDYVTAAWGIDTSSDAYNYLGGLTQFGSSPDVDYVESYAPMTLYDTLNVSGAVTLDTQLAVSSGGTGVKSFASGQALIGNGTGAISTKAITDNTSAKAMSSTSTNLVSERSVSYAIAHLVDSAPETLNTLNELAAALGDDPNFATTIATEIGKKENAFSVLPIAKGGTGITVNPSILVNLGSTAADNVFKASPRPGVTGTLPIANGGTGSTTASGARAYLGAAHCQIKTTAATQGSAGWYRIAESVVNTDNVMGTFEIKANVSGYHSVTTLMAGTSFGIHPSVQQLSHYAYSNTGISKARIVYHPTYQNNYAYLEVYQPQNISRSMTVKLTEGYGWTVIAPTVSGGIPSGYSVKEITLASGKIVSNIYESNLDWGGRHIQASVSPVDAAMSQNLSANRFALAKAAGVTVEYSTDGGSTYQDYGLTNTDKINLISGIGSGIYVGKKTSGATAQDRLRVTLSATEMGVYTRLRKILINVSQTLSGSKVKVEKSLNSAPNTFSLLDANAEEIPISGDTCWNSIAVPGTLAFGSTPASQCAKIRLTFYGTGSSGYMKILDIMGFGDTYWNYPSQMSKTGHLYGYDANGNASFPGKISASNFIGVLDGNAASATKVNNNLVIKLNSGTTENTNLFTFNGSAAKTINITPASIGADSKGSINRTFSTAPIYSYSTGVLIDFNMNEKSGSMVVVKIYGNSYNKDKSPIEAIYQFYDGATGAINDRYCGTAISGPSIPLQVYRISGKLKAWFQQPTDYCTFRVEAFYGNNSNTPNITLSNGTAPTEGITQTITITPKKVYAGASNMADNMLLTKSGLDMIATDNYIANGKLAIGSSSAPNENLYVNGTSKFNGVVHIQNSTDATLTSDDSALIIGSKGAEHIEIDSNEIMAKSNTTTAGTLYLQHAGGQVYINGITRITDATDSTATNDGALAVTGGVGIGKTLRVAGSAAVAGVVVAGASGTAATTNKLSVYGQSQFNGNAAVTGTLNVGSTSQFGNVITLHNSSDAAKQKITTTAGAMYLSSASTLYLDSGSGSSLIFRPQGTEQARFNTSGQLELKSTGAANATIIGPGTAGTFYFPNTGGTFVTHATRGTAVGSATTAPVYIASTGRATAITSVDIAHGGTSATTAAAARTNLETAYCQIKAATTAAKAQWYRIAKTEVDIKNVMGTFEIELKGGNYSVTTLRSGISYNGNPSIQQLFHSTINGYGITKARLVYPSAYQNNYAYLEVYQSVNSARTLTVKSMEGFGWILTEPNIVGEIPTGYLTKEINLIHDGIISKNIVADNTTLYGKLVVDNDSTTTTNNVVIKGQIRQDSSMTTNSYNAGTITFPTYYKQGANDNLIFDLGGVANRQIVITITGNSYTGNQAPIHSMYQFYHMNNTITGIANARSYGCPLGDLKIYQENSRIKACLLKNSKSFQTLNISIQYSHSTPDEVSFSVVNSADDPTATKTILATLTPRNYANIEEGGTGATTAAAARTNLGITPANIGASGLQIQTKIINATAGWYRIAKTYAGINNVMGTFEIKAADSNRHSLTTLIAGSSYGVSPSIQQLYHSHHGQGGITKARLVYHTNPVDNYAYLEVYQPTANARTLTVQLSDGFGWILTDPNTTGAIPSGYSSKEIELINDGIVSKNIVSNNITLSNNLTVNGNTTLGDAQADTITIAGKAILTSGITYGSAAPEAVYTTTTAGAATTPTTGQIYFKIIS